MDKTFKFFIFFLALVIVPVAYQLITEYQIKSKIERYKQVQVTQKPTKQVLLNDKYIDVAVNEPIPLSYKTKEEVFNIRKEYVAKSIFKNPNYEPSQEVFGQIVDGLPWMSMNACQLVDLNKPRIDGPSEESRFIVNPSALIVLEAPYSFGCEKDEVRLQDTIKSIQYNEAQKKIIVKYEKLNFPFHKIYYQLNAINARDLGYKYMFVDKRSSTFDLDFQCEDEAADKFIFEPQNFIHQGYSCKYSTGCNNGSPNQCEINIWGNQMYANLTQPNKTIFVKLWKEKPRSPYSKPDMTEIIVIENSPR